MSGPENPPAFPRDERYLGHNGMTLRDWFAGQALPMCWEMNREYFNKHGGASMFMLSSARDAYEAADTLLAARNTGAQS